MSAARDDDAIKLVHVTTVPSTLGFLRGQVGYMKGLGYEVSAISSPGGLLDRFAERERIAVHALAMERRIAPARDLVALGRLWRLLRRLRPRIVHAHTPKGGLLGTLAGWLAGVPVRIYHIHGLPFMTARGFKRQLLRRVEWACCKLARQVYCVSPSIRAVALAEGLCPPEKAKVLLGGSINGVDAGGQFDPAQVGAEVRREVRAKHGIPQDALVLGYVGRIVRDKGLIELVMAWNVLRAKFPALRLLVVGSFEAQDPVPPAVEAELRGGQGCHLAGQVDDPAPCYAAMDLVVLPSYREGLGYALIEAGAMALPVVATRIPGCVDAVVDGQTGTLVPPRDALALAAAIREYLVDPELRRTHGTAGRARVLAEFRREAIWEAMAREYERLLERFTHELRPASRRAAPSPQPSPRRGEGDQLSPPPGCAEGRRHLVSPSPRGEKVPEGRMRGRFPARWDKRLLDLMVAATALVLLAPVLAAVALAILLAMGRPVLFRQVRPGRHARPFRLVKFRTMSNGVGPDGQPLPDAERLTPLGRLLRQTSLDELPQLWNVLRGDLSLVGPRPLLLEYLPLYTPEQARRHDVPPGITGWAQVNGRNAISWEQKFAYDVWYVDHWSLWLDLTILWLTARKVIRRDGVSAAGEATTTRFRGSRSSLGAT